MDGCGEPHQDQEQDQQNLHHGWRMTDDDPGREGDDDPGLNDDDGRLDPRQSSALVSRPVGSLGMKKYAVNVVLNKPAKQWDVESSPPLINPLINDPPPPTSPHPFHDLFYL